MGRKSTFNAKDAEEIVSRLSKGEPMAAICRDDWLPTDRTVRNWIEADAAFASAIARAREDGFDAIAAQCLQIADGTDISPDATPEEKAAAMLRDAQRDRLRVDTRLKLLSKWDPKRYGDKVALTGGSAEDSPVQFQNVTDRDRAKAMAALVAKSRIAGD